MHRYQVGFIPTWGIYKYPQENKDWFSIWKSVIKVDILNKQNYSHFRDTEKAFNKIDIADKKNSHHSRNRWDELECWMTLGQYPGAQLLGLRELRKTPQGNGF